MHRTPEPKAPQTPTISARDPKWLDDVGKMATERVEFRLVDVADRAQVAQVVSLIVEHELWIEACCDGFLVTRIER